MLRLVFQHAEHLHAAELKELLAEHLRGFREAFSRIILEHKHLMHLVERDAICEILKISGAK